MIHQIAPQFFTMDIPRSLAYYKDKLGSQCLSTWQDPPVYAIVARDQHAIHFRCAEPPAANPDKYADELLDAYLFVQDADALYAEYAARRVEFTRELGNTPWNSREFVEAISKPTFGPAKSLILRGLKGVLKPALVKDCDGRLLAFGAHL